MTHIDKMIMWFRGRGRQATLGEILHSGESWAYEFRARMTDARKRGFDFVCEKGSTPSENLYVLNEVICDEDGQCVFFAQEKQKVRYH